MIIGQKSPKSRLFEMMIGGQGVMNPSLTHEDKADRVAQGIAFVELFPQQVQRGLMSPRIDPEDFNTLRLAQIGERFQGHSA